MSKQTIAKPEINRAISAGDGNYQARSYTGALAQSSDRILRTRGAGDLAIYEQVLSDPQVKACFEQRRNAVTAREWQVDAGGDRRVDHKAADHLRRQLQRVGFDAVTDRMLYGVHYGFSVAEVIWDVQDGLYGWSAIKTRKRRKFRFTDNGELRLFSSADPWKGVPAEPPYFWHFATGTDSDDEPYGMGLAHWCYWPTLFKRQGIGFWLTFLDKFAAPTVLGKFQPGTTDAEINRLLAACQAIRSDSSVAIPDGMLVELLEAARSGTADYKTLHDTMDAMIAKVVIGQTASSQGTPGRLGNDNLQADVRLDIVKSDADLVCESLNVGPVQWLTQFNFPDAAPPRVFRVVQEPEDANSIAERDAKVKAMGFAPSLDYIREQYGDHWDLAAPAPAPLQAPAQAEFAEGRNAVRELPDAIAERLERDAGPQLQAWIDRLQSAVEESADYADFNARLQAEFADLPTEQLSALVGNALLTAELGGRADVQDEMDAERERPD